RTPRPVAVAWPPRRDGWSGCRPSWSTSSSEVLPLPPVGRHRLDQLVTAEQVEGVEALAHLPCLGVAEPHPVTEGQVIDTVALHGGLHLTDAFGPDQPGSGATVDGRDP